MSRKEEPRSTSSNAKDTSARPRSTRRAVSGPLGRRPASSRRSRPRNSRDRRAIRKSAYGRRLIGQLAEMSSTRSRPPSVPGVRVPGPLLPLRERPLRRSCSSTAPAPASRLADFTFTAEEATALHQEVFLQVKALLGTGRIHGDLSAYNVLMAANGPTIIDLPQVVEVAGTTTPVRSCGATCAT